MGIISLRFTYSKESVLGVKVPGMSLGGLAGSPWQNAAQATARQAPPAHHRSFARTSLLFLDLFGLCRSFVIEPKVIRAERKATRRSEKPQH
jgi:hypothetical protein